MKAILKKDNKVIEVMEISPEKTTTPRVILNLESDGESVFMFAGQEGEGYIYESVEYFKCS